LIGDKDSGYDIDNVISGDFAMKKIFGTALIATMLAGTAAHAQQIEPLETTASSQAQLFALGAVPTGFIVVGTVIILGVVYAVAEESDGTTGTVTGTTVDF
jgi:hypothetical protein